MGSEIPIKIASQVNCESNLFDVAYLALGGKASSKMSRSKLPMRQILAAAENLAMEKPPSKFPRAKMPWGNFCFTRRNLLLQKWKVITLYIPSDGNKTILEEPKKRDNQLIYSISRLNNCPIFRQVGSTKSDTTKVLLKDDCNTTVAGLHGWVILLV